MTSAPLRENEPHSAPAKPSGGIRLLVVDEAVAFGGVERLWLSLLPVLAGRCEHLVWMVPSYRMHYFQAILPASHGIHFETFHTEGRSAATLLDVVIRQVGRRMPAKVFRRIERMLENRRLHHLSRKHLITHVLYPALFNQSFPALRLPVWAVVHDVNFDARWREECLANLPKWASRTQRLISNSDFTRDEVVRVIPEFRSKVVSIPIASDGPKALAARNSLDLGVRQASPVPCLYYPASIGPHKGHAVLFQALRALHDDGVPLRLILTGGSTEKFLGHQPLHPFETENARAILATAPPGFRALVEARGMVPPEEVETCFAACNLVVIPSCYEGFGLPLAEAVARGKQVLCSNLPALREQVRIYGFDQAVTFVAGSDSESWALAIREALARPARAPYSPDEIERIFARWTWDDVADRYAAVLCGA